MEDLELERYQKCLLRAALIGKSQTVTSGPDWLYPGKAHSITTSVRNWVPIFSAVMSRPPCYSSQQRQQQPRFFCECGQPSMLNQYLPSQRCVPAVNNHDSVSQLPCSSSSSPHKTTINHQQRQETSSQHQRVIKQRMKHEFIYYCSNSTIRGMPRIAKARNRTMRMLWLFSFLLLMLGLVVCVYLLIRQFSEYNVIHPPRVLRDADFDFPAVTVCNSRPLSAYGKQHIEEKRWRGPLDFARNLNKWAAKHYYHKDNTVDYKSATSAMQLSAYLESLSNDDERFKLSHERERFVIYCQISYLSGSKGVAKSCDQVGNWTDYIHPFHIRCSTFNIKKQYRNITKTMEVNLYLQEPIDELICTDCSKYDIKSQISGAVLGIDRPGTFSEINEKSIILMPGTLTEIRLKTFNNIQITPPYGHCSKETPKTLQMFDRQFVYSELGCKKVTIQKDMERTCNCISVENPYDSNNKVPFCTAMPKYLRVDDCNFERDPNNRTCIEALDQVVRNINCRNKVTLRYQKDYIENCTLPCAFLSYESDRSTSKWPTKSYQMTFFKQRQFRKYINRTEFKPYRDIQLLQSKNQTRKAAKLLDQTSVIERNFLAILIGRPNFNLHKVEEKEVLSLTSLLSQLGGLCSIWIGLSMISLVELVELVLQLVNVLNGQPGSVQEVPTSVVKPEMYADQQNLLDSRHTTPACGGHRYCTSPPSVAAAATTDYCQFISTVMRCQRCNSETVL